MRNYVDEGRVITTPDKLVSNDAWNGLFYTAIDPETGEGLYAIGERVVMNGGWTVDDFQDEGNGLRSTLTACNAQQATTLASSQFCKVFHAPATQNSCIGNDFISIFDTSLLTSIENEQGWNFNTHGTLLGKVSYNHSDVIFTDTHIKFVGKPYGLSQGNYNYWQSCSEIKNKFQNYSAANNYPIYNHHRYKFSPTLGTVFMNQNIRGLYYSPNQNFGNIYSVRGVSGATRFYYDVDEPYKRGVDTKVIQLLGYPTSEQVSKETTFDNGQTMSYEQQEFLNGYLFSRTGLVYWLESKFVLGDIAKYWEQNYLSLGIPKLQNPDFTGAENISQAFTNDKLVLQDQVTGQIRVIDDGGYKCSVGNNRSIENEAILALIGVHGVIDEMGAILEGGAELLGLVTHAIIGGYKFASGDDETIESIRNIYHKLSAIPPSEMRAFLQSTGNAVALATHDSIMDELTSSDTTCPARQAYLSGRASGLIASFITGYTSIARSGKLAKDGIEELGEIVNHLDKYEGKNLNKKLIRSQRALELSKKIDTHFASKGLQKVSNPSNFGTYGKTFSSTNLDADLKELLEQARNITGSNEQGELGETFLRLLTDNPRGDLIKTGLNIGNRIPDAFDDIDNILYEVKNARNNVGSSSSRHEHNEILKDIAILKNGQAEKIIWMFLDKGPTKSTIDWFEKVGIEYILIQ
ncbi:hypothetical protein MK079_04620 [Candidatus Gracilibacteria bacterium]|nr:hypothetical protein [Candidatus Gracilibacteria bacterium]